MPFARGVIMLSSHMILYPSLMEISTHVSIILNRCICSGQAE